MSQQYRTIFLCVKCALLGEMNEQFIVPVHKVFLAVICRLPLWHKPTEINHMPQDLEFSATILFVPNARSTDQAEGFKPRTISGYTN
jgi:hypothetical protein